MLTHCATDRQAAEPLLHLLRRLATESAREEARMFCDELMAEEATAPHDPSAQLRTRAARLTPLMSKVARVRSACVRAVNASLPTGRFAAAH